MTEEEKQEQRDRAFVMNEIMKDPEDSRKPDSNGLFAFRIFVVILLISGMIFVYGLAGTMVFICYLWGMAIVFGIFLPWLVRTISR